MRTTVPIDRALSKLGLASRAEARVLIREGRVRANGRLIEQVGERVKLDAKITISGTAQPAESRQERTVIAFNKPRGVVTTARDPEGKPTVFQLLEEKGMTDHLQAVGRLGHASTGVLLLTNDSELVNELTDAVRGALQKYAVVVRGRVAEDAIAGLPVHHVEIRKAAGPETHLFVTLTPGKNPEIHKMFEAIGHEVTRLHRVEFGPISLGKLQPGDWIDVSDAFSEKVASVLP